MCWLNPGVEIHHDSSVGDYDLIYTNSVVRTYAKVGKCVRIGSNVTICNNATVPDGADVPDCTAVYPEVKKMNILVTGAKGMVGTALCEQPEKHPGR